MIYSSCKEEMHEISPRKLEGFWELQNDVKFSDLKFRHMFFFTGFEISQYTVDPIDSDTIYSYREISIKGDTLLMMGYHRDTLSVKIKELSDSLLIMKDFPGASDELVFANYHYFHGFKKERCTYYTDTLHTQYHHYVSHNNYDEVNLDELCDTTEVFANSFPKDSLDIIIKTNAEIDNYFYSLCSKEDMVKTRKILEDYFNEKGYLKDGWKWDIEPKSFDEYFRQYIGLPYSKDKKIVRVVMHHRLPVWPFRYMSLKTRIPLLDSDPAGSTGISVDLLQIEVDVDNGKVLEFTPHYVP